MSIGAALRGFNPHTITTAYEEISSAAATAISREAVGDPDQPARRIGDLGFVALSVLRKGLDRTVAPHYSGEQRAAFSRATGLYMDTMAELASGNRDRNSILAGELLYLSQSSSLEATITEAIKSTVRKQLEEDIPGQAIVEAAARFPALMTISSEIDVHHAGSGTPDERDGFQRGLFNSAIALDALAVRQEQN